MIFQNCKTFKAYKYLNKAERKIKSGNLKNVEFLLNKADTTYMGFCGNAYAEIDIKIVELKGKYFLKKKDTTSAIKTLLDNAFNDAFADNREVVNLTDDLLKRVYSKKELTEKLDQSIEAFYIKEVVSKNYSRDNIFIDFLNHNIRFYGSLIEPEINDRERIIEEIRETYFYKKITGKKLEHWELN